jgi:hypothetical protein
MAEMPDDDLAVTHRTLAALIDAMAAFRRELAD